MDEEILDMFKQIRDLKCCWMQSKYEIFLQFVWQDMRLREIGLHVTDKFIRVTIQETNMIFKLFLPIDVSRTHFKRFRDHLLVTICKTKRGLWPQFQLNPLTKTILIKDEFSYQRTLLPVLDADGIQVLGDINEICLQSHNYDLRARNLRPIRPPTRRVVNNSEPAKRAKREFQETLRRWRKKIKLRKLCADTDTETDDDDDDILDEEEKPEDLSMSKAHGAPLSKSIEVYNRGGASLI